MSMWRHNLRFQAALQLLPALESGEETLVGGQAVLEGVMMRSPHAWAISVRKANGSPLMEDISAARSEPAGVVWERRAAPGVEYFGLGARTDAVLGLGGQSLRADTPFLVSTAGYGEFHNGSAPYRFDFSASRPSGPINSPMPPSVPSTTGRSHHAYGASRANR